MTIDGGWLYADGSVTTKGGFPITPETFGNNWNIRANAVSACHKLRKRHPNAPGILGVMHYRAGTHTTVWQEASQPKKEVQQKKPTGSIKIRYDGKDWTRNTGVRDRYYTTNVHSTHVNWTACNSKSAGVFNGVVELVGIIREEFPNAPEMTIVGVDDGAVYWSENTTRGDEHMEQGDLAQPLNIPRTTVIAALQEKLDAETAEREARAAELAEKRAELTAAISELSDDELTNAIIYATGGFGVSATLERLKKDIEDERWVSPEDVPTETEDELTKLVRVLRMATATDNIEVSPTDKIYPLL